MKKSTHPLLQLLVMLAIALVLLLATSIATAGLMLADVDMLSRPGMLWMQSLTQLLTFVLPVVLMTVVYYRGQAVGYYRLDFAGGRWLGGLAGVVALLLLMPVIDWLSVWNDGWDLGRIGEKLRELQDKTEGVLDQMMGTTTVGGLLSNLLVVALIPAVCEEVFFRAGIQNLLQRWLTSDGRRPWAVHVAIWLTALVFSLAHGELFSSVPRLLLGALLGYLYVYGRSLVPNVLVHFTNNAIVVLLYWLSARGVIAVDPSEPLRIDPTLTACCTLAAAGILWVTFFRTRSDEALKC